MGGEMLTVPGEGAGQAFCQRDPGPPAEFGFGAGGVAGPARLAIGLRRVEDQRERPARDPGEVAVTSSRRRTDDGKSDIG